MSYTEQGWIPASVGCHWTRGTYMASTIQQGTRSGYVLYHNRAIVVEFVPWTEIERLADRRLADRRVG